MSKKISSLTVLSDQELRKARVLAREHLAQFENKSILVVGDVGLDEYVIGDVRRISPEAPVPVVEVKDRKFCLGLAANVAQNIHSLGGICKLVGLVGNDETSNEFSRVLKDNNVSPQFVVSDSLRPTTRKVRVMSGQHHIVRVDFEEKAYLSEALTEKLIQHIESLLPECIGVIVQDYGKGVVSEMVCQNVITSAHKVGLRVLIDPYRTTPLRTYRGSDLIKPNRDEAFVLSGLNLDDLRTNQNSVHKVASAIQEQSACENLIITQGSQGVLLYDKNGVVHVPTTPQQVFDVTGAGDTYLAAFALGFFTGLDRVTAAVIANAAAGIVVGKVGSVPCTINELSQALENF